MSKQYNIISILGHTAASKTSLAANLASRLDGEVISADSRQVYRGMSIGTGKDYQDYNVGGKQVNAHLIDIVDAGYEYNVYEFQKDFIRSYKKIVESKKLPIMCGGTGLYLESVLRQYELVQAPVDESFRKEAEKIELAELVDVLNRYRPLHNTTDILSKKRVVRAIEIAMYEEKAEHKTEGMPEINSLNVGIKYERDERRSRITKRLEERLKEGMLDEVQELLKNGVTHDKLEYYGLEYKYISRYISGKITYEEMFRLLNTAIHQFAKRQMTYFRGMEKRGVSIHWIEGTLPLNRKTEEVIKMYHST